MLINIRPSHARKRRRVTLGASEDCHDDESADESEIHEHEGKASEFVRGALDSLHDHGNESVDEVGRQDTFDSANGGCATAGDPVETALSDGKEDEHLRIRWLVMRERGVKETGINTVSAEQNCKMRSVERRACAILLVLVIAVAVKGLRLLFIKG
jgi:hypothetical protein